MTLSSLVLGAVGVILTFTPDLALLNLNMEADTMSLLLGQIIGALYFGYAMLNWMTKESLIGGIYNRPIAIANFTHFLIAGLAIVKLLMSNRSMSTALWTIGGVYIFFGIAFLLILFRHPSKAG